MRAAPCRAVLALACALSSGQAAAMDLALTGGWAPSLSAADLVAGAGSDLRGTTDSGASEVLVDISLTTGNSDAWRVEVRRIDSLWDTDLRVWVRRRGEGSGTGTILDGLAWTEVGVTNTIFFEGTGDRDDIPVQLRISGTSLGVTPDIYLAALQYTLVDTL